MSAKIAEQMLVPSPKRAFCRSLPALTLGAFGLTSCADAEGRFHDFQTRLGKVDAGSEISDAASASPDASDEGGPCLPPAPNTVSGPALLAVETSLAEGHPILFLGTITTPASGDTTAVRFVYRALDSLDRSTPVGPDLTVGPYALVNGELSAPVAESTLDGNANPVLHGAPITSKMTLTGEICGVRAYYCGTVAGETTGLLSGPFTGRFAITLLDGPHAVPERPRFGCGAEDLAAPLTPR